MMPPETLAQGAGAAPIEASEFESLLNKEFKARDTQKQTAVQNAVRLSGLAFSDAITLATATPARVLGLGNKGLIAPQADADLLVWNEKLDIAHVIRGGQLLAPAS